MSDFYTCVTHRILQSQHPCFDTDSDGQYWSVEAKRNVLLSLGVTHILNVANDACLDGPFQYKCLPMIDDKLPDKPVEWFKECLDWTLPLLVTPEPILLIHCMSGVARSSAITYAILRALGLSPRIARACPES